MASAADIIYCPFFYKKSSTFLRIFCGSNGRKLEIKSNLHSICFHPTDTNTPIELSFSEEISKFVNILCVIQRYMAEKDSVFNIEAITISQGEKNM